MKSVKFILTAFMVVISGVFTFGQAQTNSKMTSVKTVSIKVMGNCDLCKTRIEKAAKTDGVNKAEWNTDTKVLTLVYNPAVTSSDSVQKRIAAVGHDTEKYKADDKVYNSLPGCCKYR